MELMVEVLVHHTFTALGNVRHNLIATSETACSLRLTCQTFRIYSIFLFHNICSEGWLQWRARHPGAVKNSACHQVLQVLVRKTSNPTSSGLLPPDPQQYT